MPVGKYPFFRYKIINECLTNKRKPYPSFEDFQNALSENDIHLEKRALESDLHAMRYDKRLGYNAPIAYSRKHDGYYYTDPDYNLEKLPLSADEVEAFGIIVESFKRFRGAEVLQHVEGMFDKLDKVVMKQLKTTRSRVSYTVVDFDKVPYSKGVEHFDKLYQAAVRQQPLLIAYKKFEDDKVNEHVFHPYLLKEYKFRWYVMGYSEKRRAKLILALDRIENIANHKGDFKLYKGIEVQKYFDHTIGVTINKSDVKEIRLWFSRLQGNFIKTQHLHATQKIVSDTADGMVVTLQLIPNYELLQVLLSFGSQVKVLAPESLRDELKQTLLKSLSMYQ